VNSRRRNPIVLDGMREDSGDFQYHGYVLDYTDETNTELAFFKSTKRNQRYSRFATEMAMKVAVVMYGPYKGMVYYRD
jgi:hypothetical protein